MSESVPVNCPQDPVSAPGSAASTLTFEESLAELETIVEQLEEGRLGLETSLLRYQSGIELLRQCYQMLETAERRIEVLTGFDAGGVPQTARFDSQATFPETEPAKTRPARKRSTRGAPSAGESLFADPAENEQL